MSGHGTSAGQDFAPVHFSSADVSPRDRIAIFREMLGQQLVRLDIEPLRDWPFQAEATLRRLPGARLATWDTSGLRVARTRALLADNDDAISLVINLGRTLCVSAQGRRLWMARGDTVPLHTMEPATSIYSSRLQLTSVTVPRTALAPFVAHLEDAVMQVIPPSSEPLRLLLGYLQAVGRSGLALATPEVRHLAVTHLQ